MKMNIGKKKNRTSDMPVKYCHKCGFKIQITEPCDICEFCRQDKVIKPRDTHPYQAMRDWPYT